MTMMTMVMMMMVIMVMIAKVLMTISRWQHGFLPVFAFSAQCVASHSNPFPSIIIIILVITIIIVLFTIIILVITIVAIFSHA